MPVVRQWLLAGLVGLALLLPSQSWAAGFWNVGRGASNHARGAANIANPDDPSAVFTNPAALAGHRGLQLVVDSNLVFESRQFARASDSVGGPRRDYDPVASELPAQLPSPGIFVSYNFASRGLEGLSLGAGVYGPPRTDRSWDRDGPQRYGEIESHNLQVHQALALAYELPWYGIRIGLAAMMTNQFIDTELKLNAPITESPSQPEDGDYDVAVRAEAEQYWIPGAIIGISAAPVEWLRLGASFQTPYDVSAAGKAEVALSDVYANIAQMQGEDLTVKLKMPAIFRLAVQYADPAELFDVEVALVWEGWSRNEAFEFIPEGIALVPDLSGTANELDDITMDNRWQDTFSVRLGGSYRLIEDLWLLRAGAYFEQGAVPDERLHVGSLDLDKIGFTLGSRFELPAGLWIDLAAGLSQWLPRTVDTSEVLLDNPLDSSVVKHPVGNGIYENRQIFVMAGIGVAVDL